MNDVWFQMWIYNEVSLKTTDWRQFDQFIRNYGAVYNDLWANKLKKKWCQQEFRVYRRKQILLDNYFQSMHVKGERKPIIAFGNGRFPSSGRGERSVPTEYMKKKCKQFFETVEVDEFRTSCVCPKCDSVLVKVKKEDVATGGYREVRGLRRCSSNDCSHVSFKNRDTVGALNIARCLKLNERPNILRRPNPPRRLEMSWHTLLSRVVTPYGLR